MPSYSYDTRFLQASLDQLESYLLSDDIYRPVGTTAPHGEAPYPQMTLGAIMVSLRRARQTALTLSQRADIARIENEIETMRNRWRSAWGRKAQAEYRARLNLWRDFLEDYRNHPDANYDRFAYEVTRRVMLDLLSPEANELPQADSQMLSGLDAILQAFFRPGNFVWDEPLEPAFPQKIFWYLYGNLPKTHHQDDQGF